MRFLALCVGLLLAAKVAAAPPNAESLAERIDRHLAAAWEKAGTRPAAPADDAVFLRRVSLDLIGRIPTTAEARVFLQDSSRHKRTQAMDRLLASGGYGRHMATFWRRTWIPQTDTLRFANLADGFEQWLAVRLAKNARYDHIVREMLTAPVGPPSQLGRPYLVNGGEARAFLAASEMKPENLAANTARAFLGINLDCAQCHNHPFARWTRTQFWQTAAFFARPSVATEKRPVRLELTIPSTKKTVSPMPLSDAALHWPDTITPDTGRRLLSDWTIARDNPYFARNAVNRLWANFFGTGLVEPLDDLSGDNPPSHPKLLDELAQAFTESGFDLKYMAKALLMTNAYQLSSQEPQGQSPLADARLFARMPIRGLTGEQLYDSLRIAAGLPAERGDLDPLHALRERKRFAAQFLTERAATAQRSIVQSLALMNGPTTAAMTDPTRTPILAAVADAPFLDTSEKVESLFLAALSRTPTAKEKHRMVEHVKRGGSHQNASSALADVFWALLNSSEFSTNH